MRVKPMTKIAGCGIFVLVVVLVQLGLAKPGAAEVYDRIVAVVNNDVITMSELERLAKAVEAQSGMKPTGKMDKKMQRKMLDALINRELAKEEAKRRGIKVSPKEVDDALKQFEQRNNIPNEDALVKALSNQGLSLKEFRQQIADQMIQDRLLAMTVGAKVMISDAEVRRVYNKKFKTGGTQMHLITLNIPFPPGASDEQKAEVKQKAEAIMRDVQQGVPFAEAAGKFSLTPADAGFVAQGDLEPQVAEFLNKLKLKEVAPVITPGGLQLVQVVDRRSGEAKSFEEVAPQIRNMLMQQAMQKEFSQWVKTLRNKAHIRVML
jgi:peptidyl-prolyl cis-trans isomerase SurA